MAAQRPLKVLIAGAGMGGLTAALALLQRGMDVEVHEQAPEASEIGAGLWISPNGTRVLHSLGLKAALDAIDLPPEDRVVRHWRTGEMWSVYNRGPGAKTDHTLYMVLRAELHRVLCEALDRLKPGALHLGSRCLGFEQDARGVRLKRDGQPDAEGDVLVGADGVHSKIRQAAFGPATPVYTGTMTWRGLVPLDRLPAHHRRPLATTWLGPLAHITCYPAKGRRGDYVSFSAQLEYPEWTLESWNEVGKVEDAVRDFAGWHEDVLAMLGNAETLFKWGLFVRDPLTQWSKGRVTLLGDACHPMLPYLGQGLNMAIEDAAVVARCLDDARDDPALGLQRYEKARLDRAHLTVQRSAEMRWTFHNEVLAEPGPAKDYIHRHWNPDEVKKRYDWLFQYDALQVAV